MNHPTLAIICSAALGTSLAATHALLSPATNSPPHATPNNSAPAPISSLAPELAELRRGLSELEREFSDARLAAGQPNRRLDTQAITLLVRQLLAEERTHEGATATDDTAASAMPSATDDLLRAVLAASDVEQAQLWKQITAEGRADEVLAAFRARAEASPNDPERQLELGQAYIARIAEVGNSPLAGTLATQADGAFDRALTLDPEHHEARFYKAVSLSFWPPVFGKQPAAIEQFEVLVAQQDRRTSEPRFAETHLLLGNMYQQTGQREKALAAWARGAQLFPSHTGLARQLELAGQQN